MWTMCQPWPAPPLPGAGAKATAAELHAALQCSAWGSAQASAASVSLSTVFQFSQCSTAGRKTWHCRERFRETAWDSRGAREGSWCWQGRVGRSWEQNGNAPSPGRQELPSSAVLAAAGPNKPVISRVGKRNASALCFTPKYKQFSHQWK